MAERNRRIKWVFAVAAIALVVGTSFAAALSVVGASGASPNAPASALPPNGSAALLSRPVALTPTLKAQVDRAINSASASGFEPLRSAAASRGPSIYNMTPDAILTQAGVGNLIPIANDALASNGVPNSGFATALFGSWGGYLEAAGAGCLTGGVSAAIGAAGVSAASYTTVSVAGAVAGGSSVGGTVITKVNPAIFAVSCAIGTAVGLILYQMGINQGQAAQTCYSCLWTGFAQAEFSAFYNYLNLTDAMFSSLASLLVFAQVAFDRMADNAALLQLGSSTFNVAQDLLQSGLAAELVGIVTDYQIQVGYDFENIPMWLDALTAQGAGFGGYGYLVAGASGSENIYPQTNVYPNATGGDIHNVTAAGLFEQTAANVTFLWASIPSSPIFLTCPSTSLGTCNFRITSTNHGNLPQASFNLSVGTYSKAIPFGMPSGTYNITTGTSLDQGTVILPFASEFPQTGTHRIGTYAWEDRYLVEGGSQIESGYSSGCVYASRAAGVAVLGSEGSYWGGGSFTVPVNVSQFILYPAGDCNSVGTVAVTQNIPFWTITSCVAGSCYDPWISLSKTIGSVEFNATLNALTYWTFVRSLGYFSLASIPPDCVIPAPWQELPSQANLGALTLNESMGLYEGWLKSMGTFYGASGTFTVCGTGKIVEGWNWNNQTYLFTPGTAEYGGVYLSNGTGPIAVNGRALPSESLNDGSTWALPYRTHSSGSGTVSFSAVVNQTTVTGTSVTTNTTAVAKGDTIVVQVNSLTNSALPTYVNDTAGNVFAKLVTDPSGTATQSAVYVCNVTTKASATDAITVTYASSDMIAVNAAVYSNAGGVTAMSPFVPWTSAASGTRINFPLTAPSNGTALVLTWAYNPTNVTAPAGASFTAGAITTHFTQTNLYGFSSVATGAHIYHFGGLGTLIEGVALTIGAAGAASAVNESLIIVPTLHLITIPQGKAWPVPVANPLYVFYAHRNVSQNNTGISGAWSVLNLIVVSGNGTSNGTSDHYGVGAAAGDTIFLTACEVNFTYLPNYTACPIAVTNWTLYLTNILCGGVCGGVTPTTGGGLSSTCGGGIFFLGTIADDFANWFGSVPIVGGALSAVGCALGWVVGIALLVVIAILVFYLVVFAYRAVAGSRRRRSED